MLKYRGWGGKNMKGIISLDGGGTKSELLVVNDSGIVLYRDVVKSSNPNDIGMDIAFNNLNDALTKALSFSSDNNIEIVSIFLGIAGIEFGDSISLLKEKLVSSLNFNNIYVDGDLRGVVELGLGNLDSGLVIISGTGFNMALKNNETIKNIGGWGYIADDYLSGFDLGKDALIYASRAINGIGENTVLVDLFNKELNHTLWYSMADIYKGGVSKVASFSKLVMEGYRLNDKVCLDIVNRRIENLVNDIKNIMKDVNKKNVVLFGGVFENNRVIVDSITNKLGEEYFVSVTNKKTIYGATRVAFKYANISLNNEFEGNFISSYKKVKEC